jgi:Zn-dependent protease
MMSSLAWFFPFFQGLLLGVLAMTLHEAAHLVTALILGVKVKNVGFCWKGLYTVREAGPPAKNLLISLAGPLTNLLLIACWPLSRSFGLANLCFFFFNLIPLQGSDGDRALICWDHMRKERSTLAVKTMGSLVAAKLTSKPGGGFVRPATQSGD